MSSRDDVREELLQTDEEFRRFYEEHQEYERRLAEIHHKSMLSQDDEIEEKRIKLHKLALKDRMESIAAQPPRVARLGLSRLRFAREAWPFVLPFLLLAGALALLRRPGWAAAALVAGLLVLLFFRDPARRFGGAAETVLAPADGLVTLVDRVEDPEVGPGALPPRRHLPLGLRRPRPAHAGGRRGRRLALRRGPQGGGLQRDADRVNERHLTVIRRAERRPGRRPADRRPPRAAGGLLFEGGRARGARPVDGAHQVRLAGGPAGARGLPRAGGQGGPGAQRRDGDGRAAGGAGG